MTLTIRSLIEKSTLWSSLCNSFISYFVGLWIIKIMHYSPWSSAFQRIHGDITRTDKNRTFLLEKKFDISHHWLKKWKCRMKRISFDYIIHTNNLSRIMEREITFYVYLTGIRRQTIDIVREATQTIKYLHKACNPYRIVS